MKIKINNQESYEVAVAEEYTATGFVEFSERINKIAKVISETTETDTIPISKMGKPSNPLPIVGISCKHCGSTNLNRDGKAKGDPRQRYACKDCGRKFKEGIKPKERGKAKFKWKDRDEVIRVLRMHYTGTKAEKQAYANSKGAEWNIITKSFSNLRKRYNVQPAEIGLTDFPNLKTKGLPSIPNFIPQQTMPTPPLELKDDEEGEEKKEEVKFLAEDLI